MTEPNELRAVLAGLEEEACRLHQAVEDAMAQIIAIRPPWDGEPAGYISLNDLRRMRSGEYSGIALRKEPTMGYQGEPLAAVYLYADLPSPHDAMETP